MYKKFINLDSSISVFVGPKFVGYSEILKIVGYFDAKSLWDIQKFSK